LTGCSQALRHVSGCQLQLRQYCCAYQQRYEVPAACSSACLPACPQGYLLGVVLQPDLPACGSLVSVIGGVLISPATDRLLEQRGLVAAG
jgi:hypothetical protein